MWCVSSQEGRSTRVELEKKGEVAPLSPWPLWYHQGGFQIPRFQPTSEVLTPPKFNNSTWKKSCLEDDPASFWGPWPIFRVELLNIRGVQPTIFLFGMIVTYFSSSKISIIHHFHSAPFSKSQPLRKKTFDSHEWFFFACWRALSKSQPQPVQETKSNQCNSILKKNTF